MRLRKGLSESRKSLPQHDLTIISLQQVRDVDPDLGDLLYRMSRKGEVPFFINPDREEVGETRYFPLEVTLAVALATYGALSLDQSTNLGVLAAFAVGNVQENSVKERKHWELRPARTRPSQVNGRMALLDAVIEYPLEDSLSQEARICPPVAVLATSVYEWWKEEGHIRYDTQHDQYYVRVGAKGQKSDFKERYVGLEKRVSVGAAALASGLLEGKAKSYEHAAGKRMRRFEAEQDPATRYFESRKFEIKGGGRSRVTGMKAIGTLYLSLIAPIGRKGPGPKVGASVVAIEDAAALLFHADVEYVQRAFETVGLRPFGAEGEAYRPEDVRKQLITPVMDAAVMMYLQPAR